MRLFYLGLAAGVVTLTSPIVAEANDEPVVLTPSSPWNAHFAAEKCRLAGVFGEGEDRHVLFLEQHYPGTGAAMTVAGPAFQNFRGQSTVKLTFSDAEEPRKTEPYKGNMGELGPALIYNGLTFREHSDQEDSADAGAQVPQSAIGQLDTAFGAGMDYIALAQGDKSVRFETGSMRQAFEVLNNCMISLIEEWGLDAQQQITATKRPVWRNHRSITRRIAAEYPSAALRAGESGIVRLRVIVDPKGKVEECVLNIATATEKLESPACKQMRKAKFDPALDAQGQPMRSYFATSISYLTG